MNTFKKFLNKLTKKDDEIILNKKKKREELKEHPGLKDKDGLPES